ncbi:MAG: hypothetical protein MK207_02375 [Saprospiraceae bacterium]|nr:hypothetical protein [Saprospiraceae bacterium]
MKDKIDIVIWIIIIVCFIRGLFVFDMGASASETYPIAGAICFAGSIIAAILMKNGRDS